MKKIYFLILIILSLKSFSCTPLPYGGLCYDAVQFSTIIKGSILEVNTDFAKVLITKIYKGTELRDTIFIFGKDTTILQDTLNNCEDSIYFGADKIGNIGDEIIIALNFGDSTIFNWEKNEHYQVRDNGFGQDYLFTVKNDSVNGIIKWLEQDFDFPGYNLTQLHISDFDSLWNNGEMNCDKLLALDDKITSQKINFHPNPINNNFTITNIKSFEKEDIKINIYNIIGEKVNVEIPSIRNNEVNVNTSRLEKGVYILEIEGIGRTKLVKE